MEERFLILAPRGRDDHVIAQVLGRDGHASLACPDLAALLACLRQGASAVITTEEAVTQSDLPPLTDWLADQAAWSDVAFIVLVTRRTGRRPEAATARLAALGNVVLLERPLNAETLLSAGNAALRGRRRQYQARNKLRELASAEEELQQLNSLLETNIAARTVELRRTNERLLEEIADRKRAEATLVQMQKMEAIGHLTGGIAHDFNNLLTAVVGNIELIQRRTTDERIGRMASHAQQALDRATRLTSQLLAFSRSQQLDLHPVDIDQLINNMVHLIRNSIGPAIELRLALNANGLAARADANQLELAILNLAINARDAIGDGGLVSIGTRACLAEENDLAAGAYVVITVADSGTGIPADLLDKVFDPFFTTKSVGRGTGLGLSQVYGIARQSGGIARARNGSPRSGELEGAIMEIWLPVVEAAAEALVPSSQRLGLSGGRGEHILVIDDDPDVRRMVVNVLRSLDYVVIEAEHGPAGLVALADEAGGVNLMIVDFAMPGVNGAEIAGRAKSLHPELPIILITGYADAEAIAKSHAADMVLRKPFALGELTEAVHRFLQ